MMTFGEKIAVNAAIHSASVAAAGVGAGLAPVPGADSVPLVAIQTAMAVAIAKALGLTLGDGAAEAAVGTARTTMAGQTITRHVIGMIPVIGLPFKAGTAAALTEALGWILASEFDAQRGG